MSLTCKKNTVKTRLKSTHGIHGAKQEKRRKEKKRGGRGRKEERKAGSLITVSGGRERARWATHLHREGRQVIKTTQTHPSSVPHLSRLSLCLAITPAAPRWGITTSRWLVEAQLETDTKPHEIARQTPTDMRHKKQFEAINI